MRSLSQELVRCVFRDQMDFPVIRIWKVASEVLHRLEFPEFVNTFPRLDFIFEMDRIPRKKFLLFLENFFLMIWGRGKKCWILFFFGNKGQENYHRMYLHLLPLDSWHFSSFWRCPGTANKKLETKNRFEFDCLLLEFFLHPCIFIFTFLCAKFSASTFIFILPFTKKHFSYWN